MTASGNQPPFDHGPEEILDRITDVFFALDTGWRVTYLSSRAEELVRTILDEEPDAVLGQVLWELIPEAGDSLFYEKFHEAIDSQQAVEFEAQSLIRDAWVAVRAYPSENGLSVYFRDITKRKERQQELERQNERLEKFASIVSHDLRNPLNVAQGRLDLLAEDSDSEHVRPAIDAVDRMEHIVDNLLLLARQGQVVNADAVETTSLAALAAAAWRAIDTESATLSVETTRHLDADPEQLLHILENLFRNALDHGNPDGTIRIGDLAGGRGFFVEDDGPGIPAARRDRVFERGYTTDGASTGLGLSIVHEIVTAHRWAVTIADGTTGGARFEILVDTSEE